MAAEGRITAEEAEQLIAVLREVDAAGERLAAAGAAAGAPAGAAGAAGPGTGASVPDDDLDDAAFDAAFDEAFEAEYLDGQGETTPAADAGAAPDRDAGPEPAAAPDPGAAQEPADQAAGAPADRTDARPKDSADQAPADGADHIPADRADHGSADQANRGPEDAFAAAASQAVASASAQAREMARQAREAARQAEHAARDAAREAAREAREAAREAMRAARDTAREAAREARNAARDAARSTRDAARGVTVEVGGPSPEAEPASRPGKAIAPAGTRWVTVEMLGGDLDVTASPHVTAPAVEGGPGELRIEEVEDGYRVQFVPDRSSFLGGLISSFRSGDIDLKIPQDYGLVVEATAGDVSLTGVRYLRGRMRAGDLSADRLEGVDFGMTAGEFGATLDLRAGQHMVSVGAGNVQVDLDEASDVVVNGRVSIGDVDTSVPGLEKRGSGLGGSLSGTLGTGAARLDVRVTTGDLDVRKARRG